MDKSRVDCYNKPMNINIISHVIYKFLNVYSLDRTAFAVSGKVRRPQTSLTRPVDKL